MHQRFALLWIGLLFGALGLAVGGCGTISGEAKSTSALLASPSLSGLPATRAVAESAIAAPPDTVSNAVTAYIPPDVTPPPIAIEEPLRPQGAFTPVAFEPLPSNPPVPYMIAFAGAELPPAPVMAQAATQGSASSEPALDTEPQEYDPWEPFNEKMFTFNYQVDKWVLKPVAKAYNFVVPDEIQRMIGRAFDNINPVPKWVNNLLQLNFKGFFTELGRFIINSTLGIGGLWDIAKQEFGLEKTKVDFGQTLGKWGWGPGPFLILPFLPPLTVRDGIGYGVDGAMDPLSYVLPFIWDRLALRLGNTVNDRSLNLDLFQGFEETTVDMYSAVRNGYLQRRYNLIHPDQ